MPRGNIKFCLVNFWYKLNLVLIKYRQIKLNHLCLWVFRWPNSSDVDDFLFRQSGYSLNWHIMSTVCFCIEKNYLPLILIQSHLSILLFKWFYPWVSYSCFLCRVLVLRTKCIFFNTIKDSYPSKLYVIAILIY